jgi:hypothetical protein
MHKEFPMPVGKGSRSAHNVEKLKKKAASAIPRKKVTRNTGATKAVRTTAKRAATKARAAKAIKKA